MDSFTTVAAHSLNSVWTLLLNFLVFIVLAGLLFFFGNRMGKGALTALIASFYVAFAVYTVFPFAKLLSSDSSALSGEITALVLYAVFTGISYYIFSRSASGGYFTLGNAGIAILAILTAGFLIALSYHSFSLAGIYTFPAVIKAYFAQPQYFFWWFIAPLVGLLITAR